jgi:protein-S-isoprenylcysteine O-methyltransferase Ste14
LSEPRKFWMRWRVRLGYPVTVVYWLLAHPTPRAILIGSAVVGLGLMVRAAAAGYLRKDRELATAGPYAKTRNPLYLGSAILAAGFIVAGHSWIAGAIVAIYFAVFYYAVMRNEEDDLRARFPDEFPAYARRVPLFFPHFFSTPDAEASPKDNAVQFSWELYRRNREYRALIGTIGGMMLVGLRIWVRTKFGY